MLTLYYAKGSSALAPHILLEEVGAQYAVHEVPIAKGAHREPEYLEINPKARVPALMTPEGVITENPAILTYIAETHPRAEMLPDSPFARAEANTLCAYLCGTVHVAFAHLQRGARWADSTDAQDAMKTKVVTNLNDCAQIIEDRHLKGRWALGDQFSLCDPYLFFVPRWMAKAGADLSQFPKLAAHHDAMLQRPAVLAVMAVHGL